MIGIFLQDENVKKAIQTREITENLVRFLNDYEIALVEIETAKADIKNGNYQGARTCYDNALSHIAELKQQNLPEHYNICIKGLEEEISSVKNSIPTSYLPTHSKESPKTLSSPRSPFSLGAHTTPNKPRSYLQ